MNRTDRTDRSDLTDHTVNPSVQSVRSFRLLRGNLESMDGDHPLIPPHGGYRGLKAYQLAEIIYDGTVHFTRRCLDPRSRTVDQMVQAARSGKQNIAEGSRASATSKKGEIRLINVARASLEELLLDYEDFLRQNGLELWDMNHPKSVFIRNLHRKEEKPDYRPFIEEKSIETAANTLICLIHQANFLRDRLLSMLERQFVEVGGFTEKLYRVRTEARQRSKENQTDQSDQSDPSDS